MSEIAVRTGRRTSPIGSIFKSVFRQDEIRRLNNPHFILGSCPEAIGSGPGSIRETRGGRHVARNSGVC